MITIEHAQEALSVAHVRAIAARAGVKFVDSREHDYGLDGHFRSVAKIGPDLIESGMPVSFQLKSTTKWAYAGGNVVYDLDARAHRVLTNPDPTSPLSILILLCLPQDEALWLEGDEEHLLLRRCCYWYRVPGPSTSNSSKIRIRIPRANILTPSALQNVMRLARAEAR